MWERADVRACACACAAFYRCTRSGSSRPRCWTRCARRRRRPRRRRARMRIFVSFILSTGFFPFQGFRSDYEFVAAGDFLSILSEIERNYLYVRACIVCLFSAALAPALALGALMGMCADAQRVADWTTTGTGRRATPACLSWRTEDDDDDDYHLIHHHHHHDTATTTTTSTSTTRPTATTTTPTKCGSARNTRHRTRDVARGRGLCVHVRSLRCPCFRPCVRLRLRSPLRLRGPLRLLACTRDM